MKESFNQISENETMSKEEELKKLTLDLEKVKAEKDKFLEKEGCSDYNKDKINLFVEILHRFSGNAEMMKLYLSSIGEDYDLLLLNNEKFTKFKEKSKPFDLEIKKISSNIFNIERENKRDEIIKEELEEKKSFEKEKNDLMDVLYRKIEDIEKEVLEKINKNKDAKNAIDSGMNIKDVLNKFLRSEIFRSDKIEDAEYFIKRIEQSLDRYDFDKVKDAIKDTRWLNIKE